MSDKISNVKYKLVDSFSPNYKEVRVTFLFNGNKSVYFIFIAEKKGTNYLKEAKKIFNEDLKNGKVKKAVCGSYRKPGGHALIITAGVLAAAVLALGGVLTWKLLTPTPGGGGGDTPVVEEKVSTLTYNYSPYREHNNVEIVFAREEENNEDEPPFVGDVYVQWNKDDSSTKVKVEAGTKSIKFDYKEKYPNIDPREFTVVISGDVRTFGIPSDDVDGDGNSYFTSLKLGETITTIMGGAFNGVNHLYSAYIPGSVTTIHQEAFFDCTNLVAVDFATTDEADHLDIADSCFMGCNNLKSIHFPKRLTYLGPLKECRQLEEITIPSDAPCFTTLYKDKEGVTDDCGMLVTKKDIKSPFLGMYLHEDDIDYKKDTVVASTTHPHIYEGIKIINSLSGADIDLLYIPKSVEKINGYELVISRINTIGVERGNKNYTDLYQEFTEEGDLLTANVLAERFVENGDDGLSIIKVANEATPIDETGIIYEGDNPTSIPVTDFAYGAATNSTITSLDLPSTLKTFNFDDYADRGYMDNNHENPFHTTLTDLTIRSLEPPVYKENKRSRYMGESITEVFGSDRKDLVNICLPEEVIDDYCYQLKLDKEGNEGPGYWNFTALNPDIDHPLLFHYVPTGSKNLTSRAEAIEWVKEHYTTGVSAYVPATLKWDFNSLIEVQKFSPYYYDIFVAKIKQIISNSIIPIGISVELGSASITPIFKNGSQPTLQSVSSLTKDNFNNYFSEFVDESESTITSNFTFSIKNNGIVGVQCPRLSAFFGIEEDPNKVTGHVKRIIEFNANGIPTYNRFEISGFRYDVNGEMHTMSDFYFEYNNRVTKIDKQAAVDWANERSGRFASVDNRLLNWSFATGKDLFSATEIVNDLHIQTIEDIIRNKAGGDVTIDDLICKKNIPFVLPEPLPLESIDNSYIDNLNTEYFGFVGDHLYILDAFKPEAEGFDEYKIHSSENFEIIRISKYNDSGICDYQAFYFNKCFVEGDGDPSNPFSGYIEITSHIVE